MQRGRLVAIAVGIAIAIAIGAAFAFTSSMPNEQQVEPAETDEGRKIVVNIEEELGVGSP